MTILAGITVVSPVINFPLSQMARWVKWVALTPLVWSAHSLAGTVDGTSLTINDNDQSYQTWAVDNGGSLTINNSDTSTVVVSAGSTVNISGSNIAINNESEALRIRSSTATVADSIISSTGTGMVVARTTTSSPGSTATVSNSEIYGGMVGILLHLSDLTLSNSQVIASASNGIGFRQQQGHAIISDSTIIGGGRGLSMERGGGVDEAQVDLDHTHVEALDGPAVFVDNRGLLTSTLNVANGSTLVGGNGVMLEMIRSSLLDMNVSNSDLVGDILLHDPLAGAAGAQLNLSLDSASLTGDIYLQEGSTANLLLNDASFTGNIELQDASALTLGLSSASAVGDIVLRDASSATLSLDNGSRFTGNLQLSGASSASLSVSGASQVVGDVIAEAGSTAVVSLDDDSTLTGRLENLSALSISNGAQWQLVEDSTIADLSLAGGSVKFGESAGFQTLNVGTLSGSGTFVMNADFGAGQSDLLNVTGSASGSHQLLIASTGTDPVDDTSLHVVHINGGDASFSLLGGSVDLGTWSYGLRGDGTDWYLDASQKTISPGTASVLALFNTAPTVWYGELSSLRSRMGELRHNGGQSGAWSRAYGGKYDVSGSNGLSYSQQQSGFSIGADAPLPFGDGQWLMGVLAGHSTSDLSLARGTRSEVKSYYAGLYTTWLDAQSGYYFDGVIKFNRFDNSSNINLSDGTRAKGRYDNNALGASAEFGRHIKLDDGYFIEPSAQLASVFIQGRDYRLDNDLQASGERTRSLLGKLGATAGRRFDFGAGRSAQPYVRAAYVHEFAKGNKVSVNDNSFDNDLSGSRGELGAGVSVSIADKWDVHADFQYTDGEKLSQPWGANVGVRYSW